MRERFPLLVNSFQERNNFGEFLTRLGFGVTDTAVEVGTHLGHFAHTLLSSWLGNLKCIDPYVLDYDKEEVEEMRGDRNAHLRSASELLSPYKNRCDILITDSMKGTKLFQDESLCFVYVDACHQYQSTRDDLFTWWPKVKRGGVLAGHDIISSGETPTVGWGRYVQQAVFEFALEFDLPVYLVTGPNTLPWSYYFLKPTVNNE